MRIVIVGATGNHGTSLVRALSAEPAVTSILGLARRKAEWEMPKVEWAAADIGSVDLVPLFLGADAVVHLAWLIQPSHDLATVRAVNVEGSARVFRAVADAGVPALVYASSVGAYSPGPKDRRVDESWPTDGVPSSFYSSHKAEVERILDRFETENPGVRVVRIRPGLVFKREAATGIRRLFAGPFLPSPLLRPGLRPLLPVLPLPPRLAVQGVHSLDVADAYRRALLTDVRGAFNIAAEPVLDAHELARLLGARPVPAPAFAVRAAVAVSWRLRLQPTPSGWLDLALNVPLLDTTRAMTELGWRPQHTAAEALVELVDGLREGADLDTPPLSGKTGGPFRIREILTGIGGRST